MSRSIKASDINYRNILGRHISQVLSLFPWIHNFMLLLLSSSIELKYVCMRAYVMMTSSNGNILLVSGPLWGESTGHRWISPRKDQWRGALIFSLICAWRNGWANNRGAGDLRRHRAHYEVTVMIVLSLYWLVLLYSQSRHTLKRFSRYPVSHSKHVSPGHVWQLSIVKHPEKYNILETLL